MGKISKILLSITLAGVVMLSLCMTGCDYVPQNNSLYSWDLSITEDSGLSEFFKTNCITDLYQAFPIEKINDKDIVGFIEKVTDMGVNVSYLTGDAQWIYDGPDEFEHIVDLLAKHNLACDNDDKQGRINAVVMDIEVHTLDEWKGNEQKIFAKYCDFMIAAKEYAAAAGISVIAVIPTGYKDVDREAFDDFVMRGCDKLAVMNYYRQAATTAMAYEYELCEKNNIPVESILETQAVDEKKGVTKNITYYYDGKAVMLRDMLMQQQAYGSALSFGIHCYSSFVKMDW